MSSATDNIDLESYGSTAGSTAGLTEFSWRDLTVTVKDMKTGEPLNILEGVTGGVRPGMLFSAYSSFVLKLGS